MFTRALAVLAAAVFSLSALAAGPEAFEGHDYARVANPQPLATGNRIEVLEFFWYRCPHCFQLEPSLEKWLKKLPKDAQARRVPAVFRDDWLPGAKLYYALEQMNLVTRLHRKVFDAYHLQNINLDDPTVLGNWIAKQGVDRSKFRVAYNFGAPPKAQAGQKLAAAYDIRGVPTFIVDGKYLTSVSMTGSEARLYEVLDQLIVKARAERRAGKTAR